MQTKLSDPDLVARYAAGDSEALEQLLHRHSRTILAYVERHMPDDLRASCDPQDILQDTYFEAFRRVRAFQPDGADAMQRWLITIARNRLVDLVRKRRAAKRSGISGSPNVRGFGGGDDDDQSAINILQELAVYERTPSQSAIAHELAAAVQVSIDRLPSDYRDALRSRYMDAMPVKEIALKMNRTERAIHQLCNRALKALHAEMRSAY